MSDSVIDAIKEMIQTDGFGPGDKFYSENELTKILGVSRSSIREAIRILEVTGQVTVQHGKGVFVSDTDAMKLQPFIYWLKTNEQSLADHFQVRLIIESKTAAFAAEKADAEDIRKIERTLDEFFRNARLDRTADVIAQDRNFHRQLAGATKNKTLHMLMTSLTTSQPTGWISSLHTPGRIEKTIHEHQAILDAVVSRNPSAAEAAMVRHLDNALTEIRRHMNSDLKQ